MDFNSIKYFFNDLIKRENGDINIFGKVFTIFAIFLVAYITISLTSKVINRSILSKKENSKSFMRIVTLVKLLNKVIKFLIYFLATTIALDIVGVNTSSLIATLGIGSLALSFGAQSLVKDVINGFFIILEDQYSVGDWVQIEGKSGVVEELGIRTTTIKDYSGDIHIIPNGKISIVTNKQRGDMRAKVVFSVDLKEEPQKVIKLLGEKLDYLKKDKRILAGPNIWGVTGNGKDGYDITVAANAGPGLQFDVEYEIRQRVVEMFIENNIAPPKFRTEVKNAGI